MNREELIEKINNQSGYIDMVDAYRICSVYTDLFGVNNFERSKLGRRDGLSTEEQLIIMWDKINNYEVEVKKELYVDLNKTKICVGCNEEKKLYDYHKDKKCKDGRKIYCKVCSIKLANEYKEKRLLEDQDYQKKLNEKYKK